MTILALLIALAIERVTVKTHGWQGQTYARHYFNWVVKRAWLSLDSSSVAWFVVALVPAIGCAVLVTLLPELLEFVAHTAVLFVCIGSQALRDTYKCFMQAANRGDFEACYLYSEQMGHCDGNQDKAASFGLRLVWLSYQHYAGVLLFFVALGAPGAVFYVCVREAYEYACSQEGFVIQPIAVVRQIVDFIPVRITALGFLMVGNYAKAMPVWLKSFPLVKQLASTTLTEVASAAEVLPNPELETTDPAREPSMLVKLSKRNILFLLVITSILTLAGIV